MLHGFATRLAIKQPFAPAYTQLTGEKKFDLSLSLKTKIIASFAQLNWELSRRELSSWSATASGLVAPDVARTIVSHMMLSTPVDVSFAIGTRQCFGQAYISSLKLSGAVNGFAQWSLSLKGTGPLTV